MTRVPRLDIIPQKRNSRLICKLILLIYLEKQAYQNRFYSRLFVSHIQTLFDCDLETGRYRKIKVNAKQRRSFYEEAIKV